MTREPVYCYFANKAVPNARDCDISGLITFIYTFYYGVAKVRPFEEEIDQASVLL